MNINIVFSFIIGGLLLLAILALNSRVLQSSGQTTLSMTAKQKVETINEIMRRDFMRLGYNVDGSGCGDGDQSPAIIEATSQKIVFCADIDNNTSTKAKKITWRTYSGNEYSSTVNPNDFALKRITSLGTSKFPVTQFSFTYYSDMDNTTGDEDEVLSIAVSLKAQAPAKYADSEEYATAFLKKQFMPPNLQIAAN